MGDETWPEGPAVDWRAAFLSRGLKLDEALHALEEARAQVAALTAELEETRAKLATVTALLNQLIQP